MCLPASPFLSVQKVLGQRNVPWFSSCKIKLAECSLIWRHFCKSSELFQIWSGVWPSNPCSPHYFRPAWVQDCNHGAPTSLVVVTQVEKGDCTYPPDDMEENVSIKTPRANGVFTSFQLSLKTVRQRGWRLEQEGRVALREVAGDVPKFSPRYFWPCLSLLPYPQKQCSVPERPRYVWPMCFPCSLMQQPHAKCLLVLK